MTTEQLPGLQLAVKLLAQIGDDDSDRAIAAVHAVMDQGQPGELPDGLNIAVEMIGEYAESGTCCSRRPAVAIDAIRAEHAQRVTLQHHAADLAQEIEDLRFAADAAGRRIAELEAERDELRSKLEEIEAQEPVLAQAMPDGLRQVLAEARDLFAAYAESHRARGPEHAAKAARNEAMATKISAALAGAPEHKA